MNPILLTAAGNPENQDRGVILDECPRTILCVADGAGGRSGAALAAEMAINVIREHASRLGNTKSCTELLSEMDQVIAKDSNAGETTCALALVSENLVSGASVGDSGVWLVRSNSVLDLTRHQQRKPFIGSGSAWPVSFEQEYTPGDILLLATDGLLKYSSAEKIAATCRAHDSESVAEELLKLVRYPSGAFPDDVTIIVCFL